MTDRCDPTATQVRYTPRADSAGGHRARRRRRRGRHRSVQILHDLLLQGLRRREGWLLRGLQQRLRRDRLDGAGVWVMCRWSTRLRRVRRRSVLFLAYHDPAECVRRGGSTTTNTRAPFDCNHATPPWSLACCRWMCQTRRRQSQRRGSGAARAPGFKGPPSSTRTGKTSPQPATLPSATSTTPTTLRTARSD
jgi:hypothetical protein